MTTTPTGPRTRTRSEHRAGQPREVVTKLPRSVTHTSHRALKGAAAVGGSALLLLGVPLALILLVGNPLPTTAPSRDWLTAEVNARLVINVIAVLVWVVWVHFVVCFLSEWRALRAGQMPDRVVLGGGSQLLARQLIAGVLLLAGGATMASGLAQASHAPSGHAGTSASASAQAGTSRASVDASTGQVQATPEQQHQTSRQLKITTVKVPEGRHHDTLWGIAERTLGNPMRWKEVFELNKGRIQPDGSKMVDADLIRPGWQVVLPADAHGRDVRVMGASGTPARPAPAENPGGQQAGGAQSGAAAVAGDTAGRVQHDDGGSRSGSADEALLLGGGLILAGIATALTAKRGPFGNPDDGEDAIRLAANPDRATLLDRALRVLSEVRVGQGLAMPDVSVVYVNDEQVILHIAGETAAPAHPWRVAEDGRSWSVTASDLQGLQATAPAPYPALVNIATSHGFEVLIDLEYASGLIAVGGDQSVAREVVMSTVVDLATHAWSDSVEVTMVGFGDDITEISPDQLTVAHHLDEAIAQIEQKLGATSRLLARLGVDGVLTGRGQARHPELRPHVLVSSGAPSAEEVQRLRSLSAAGRTAFAAVCVGDAPGARWRFAVDETGSIDLGVLGISGTARRYSLEAHEQLRAMMRRIAQESSEQAREVAASGPARVAQQLGVTPAAGTTGAAATGTADAGAAAAVRLLGPVAVKAPGPVAEDHRALLTELLVMAALHPQGLHEAVITSGLWPRGVSDDVVERVLAQAQEWLGVDATGRARFERGADGLWHLGADVYVDWAVLQQCAVAGGDDEVATLVRGLGLGHGEVFSGVPAGRYTWLAFHRAARDARALVATMASRAAAVLSGAGDVPAAERALREGLQMVPEAEMLWRDLMRLLGGRGSDGAGRVAEEMRRTLPASHHFEPETDALVADLAPGSRRKATS